MNRADVERLIQFIFGTPTIKEFHKVKPLRSVLDTFAVAVILCHRRVLKYCVGTNQVSFVLIEYADHSKIFDVNHPLVPPLR